MATSPQTLKLSDDRTLSYIEYGSSSGPPVFYFHGFPASRLEGALWSDDAAKIGIRLISIDRPGMGYSTFQPSRTLLDWPKDLLELADHLNIHQFRLLGVSGGGPYVLACAKTIPRSRLVGAAIVSGLYPVALGTQGMMFPSRVLLFLSSWMPSVVGRLADWQFGKAARDSDPQIFNDMLLKNLASGPELDVQCLKDEKFKMRFLDSVREAFRQGGEGMGWEARMYGSDWGFELEDVAFEGLMLWHGTLDINTPIRMADLAAAKLNGSELRRFDEEAHISLPVHHVEEILNRLMQVKAVVQIE